MKLISLNAWGGRVAEPLWRFLAERSKDTDIFCFQEVTHKDPVTAKGASADLFADLVARLPGFRGFFKPYVEDHWGIAAFVKESFSIEKEGDVFVFMDGPVKATPDASKESRNLQYLTASSGGKKVTVMNLHGLWTGTGKSDTESRIEQSKRIAAFAKTVEGPKIICGDFNLAPDTESIKILEGIGMRNLVKDFGVKTTRTSLYSKIALSPYADYVFCTPDIKVKEFKVLPDEVSDHAALFLDFELP